MNRDSNKRCTIRGRRSSRTAQMPPLTKPASITLAYRPPFDWQQVLSFTQSHAVPFLETIDESSYQRVILTSQGLGWLEVRHEAKKGALRVSLSKGNAEDLSRVTPLVRRMFDLDADPEIVGEAMAADDYLHDIWSRNPGLRVGHAWNGYESMVTTVLGQLVSVRFARVLTAELMQVAGSKLKHPRTGEKIFSFPTPRQILRANLAEVRTSPGRRATLRSVAAFALENHIGSEQPHPVTDLRTSLRSLPGVGAWTAEYIAMRGFGDNDAFPATDYGLKQELKNHPETRPDRVRPWRAYAAVALWKNFADHALKLTESEH